MTVHCLEERQLGGVEDVAGVPDFVQRVVDFALAAVRVIFLDDLYPRSKDRDIARERRPGKLGSICGFGPVVTTGDKLMLANRGSKQFDDGVLLLGRQPFQLRQ